LVGIDVEKVVGGEFDCDWWDGFRGQGYLDGRIVDSSVGAAAPLYNTQ
jgi:hypothetical protein